MSKRNLLTGIETEEFKRCGGIWRNGKWYDRKSIHLRVCQECNEDFFVICKNPNLEPPLWKCHEHEVDG